MGALAAWAWDGSHDERERRENMSELSGLLETVINDAVFVADQPTQKADRYLRRNLRLFREQLTSLFADSPEEYRVVTDVIQRLRSSSHWERDFLLSLSSVARRVLREGGLTAEGEVLMQNFYVPVPFKEDRWVEAVELRPGNPAVVHCLLSPPMPVTNPTGTSPWVSACHKDFVTMALSEMSQ
jgi:hypothetical protein